MKKINRLGARYGKLLVVAQSDSATSNGVFWVCQCECGNMTTVRSGNLSSGNTTSCGCSKSTPSPRRIDLSGRRFGRLVVLSGNQYNGRQLKWSCLCDCGNTTVVAALKLQRGATRSCGCLKDEVRRTRRKPGPSKWARELKAINQECVACGAVNFLHAHHIFPVSTNKGAETDYSNGVVLCQSCHSKFHKQYGKHTHGANELAEFLGLHPNIKRALGYFCRWEAKNGREDLEKAKHEIDLLIELRGV